MSDDANLLVEIHVPLTPAPGLAVGDYPYPWIEDTEEFLAQIEEQGIADVYEDGEEVDGAYVFFITGASEGELIAVAARVAALPTAPGGVFAMITAVDADAHGMGERVELLE